MNMARVMVCSVLLSLGWLAQPVLGQDAPGVASVYSGFGFSNPYDTRVIFQTDVGDGRGYDDGFQDFRVFQPLVVSPDRALFFIDAGVFTPFTGDWGSNVGTGVRYYDPYTGYVFGASGWYDRDITSIRQFRKIRDYERLGVSFEALGPVLDFRVNGYLPTDDDPVEIQRRFTGVGFQGFNIVSQFETLTEVAMRGGDFEIGGPLPWVGCYGVRGYAGGYYLEGEGVDTAYGVSGRLEVNMTEDLAVQARVTEDRVFGNHVTLGMAMRFGSGRSPQWFCPQPNVNRLYARTIREQRIQIKREIGREVEILQNPADNQPFLIFHVLNTAPAGGNGSFEAPLNFLPPGVDPSFDVIFVLRGDGSSTGYTGGITLADDQRLLGEGVHHRISTTTGLVDLPNNTAGSVPVLGGAPVVLANRNEVSGFLFSGNPGDAIRGTGIGGFDLNRLRFAAVFQGINLDDVTGAGRITDTNFDGVITNAIRLDNDGPGEFTLTTTRMTMTGSDAATGLRIDAAGGAVVGSNLIDSSISGTDTAVDIDATTGATVISFIDPTFLFNNDTGLDMRAVGAAISSNVLDTHISNNLTGVRITTDGVALVNHNQIRVRLADNTDVGLIINNTLSNVGFTSLFDQIVGTTAGNGVTITSINGGSVTASFSNSLVDSNFGHGVRANITNSSLTFNANNGVFTRNGTSGVSASLLNSFATVNTLDSNFSQNAAHGFQFQSIGALAAISRLTYDRTLFNANTAGSGLFIDRRDNTHFAGILTNSRLTNNTIGSGLRVDVTGAANVNSTIFVQSNVFDSNNVGANYSLSGDAALIASHALNSYSSNINDGVQVTTIQASAFGVPGQSSNFDGEIAFDNGRDGYRFVNNAEAEVITNAFQYVQIVGTNLRTRIEGNNGNGVTILERSDIVVANPSWTIKATDLVANQFDGVHMNSDGDATSGLFIGDNGAADFVTILNSGDDGVEVIATDGTTRVNVTGNATLTRSLISNNGATAGSGTTDATRGDGISIVQTDLSTGLVNFYLSGVESSFNRGRGVNLDIENRTALSPGTSSFTLGVAADPGSPNIISNNFMQGVVMQTIFRTTPPVTLSTSQLFLSPAAVESGSTSLYEDEGSVDIVTANFKAENNFIQFNGTVGTPSDGLLLAIGTNTRLNAVVNGNQFGGNSLFDVNNVFLRSVNTNAANTDDAVAGPPVLDLVAQDPIGHLDLAFGVFSSTGSQTADSQRGNFGDRVAFTTIGSATSFTGSTDTGLFTNSDYAHAAGRNVFGRIRVFGSALVDGVPVGNPPGNSFFQLGVPQNITDTFNNANLVLDNGGFNSVQMLNPGSFPFNLP